MASSKPVIHGRDHLPGGADPIPYQYDDTAVYFAHLSKTLSSMPAADTVYTADFTGASVQTNDGGAAATTTHASPFTGSVFAYDTTTYPDHPLALLETGLYVIELWYTHGFNTFPSVDMNIWVQLNDGGGSRVEPGHPLQDSRRLDGSTGASSYIASLQWWSYVYGAPLRIGVNYQHDGLAPDFATVGIHVARLGPPIPAA